VLIEPQRRAFETLKANYASQPQVKFFNVAIGPKDGELTLFTRKSEDVSVAGTRQRLLINPGHGRAEIQSYAVPCWTLETLLTNAGADATIDLLQIDAEGNDYDIIHSIDYRRIKPTILRYEHLLMSHRQKNACMALLEGHGYRFIVEENDTLALAARLPDEIA
jgi:FkbM family methyltransferase